MLFVLIGASLGSRPLSADELKKSGTVDIEQTQIAFIGSGNLGGIVAIRTFLSISLDVEINGHWPWETTRLSQETAPAAGAPPLRDE